MSREDLFDGDEGEVREVLMINRIELVLIHQPHQMWKLHGNDAVGLEQDLHPAHEIVQPRYVGQHVVAHQEIGSYAFGYEFTSRLLSEELDNGGDPSLHGCAGHIGCGLDTEDRYSFGNEVLQKVTVIAGDFYDPPPRAQSKTLDYHVSIGAGVLEPGFGIRRKVRVVREDRFWTDNLVELDEKTEIAHIRMERIKRLHLVQLGCFQEVVGKRRGPQVHKGGSQY